MEPRVSATVAGSGPRKDVFLCIRFPRARSSQYLTTSKIQDTELGHVSKATEAHSNPLEDTVAERVIKTPLGVTCSVCSLSLHRAPDIRFADKSSRKGSLLHLSL